MIESEWVTAARPADLVEFVFFDTAVSDRKLRLFACVCAAQVSHFTGDEAFTRLLRLAEAYADGRSTADSFKAQNAACAARYKELHRDGPPYEAVFARMAVLSCGYWAGERKRDCYQPHDLDFPYPLGASQHASGAVHYAAGGDPDAKAKVAFEESRQVALLHDIFGNPFRPSTVEPEWRTEHTVGIATKMYDERKFDAMPVLADALQDAGCEEEQILGHCRGPGPHVRGCWVVDLVLGKE